MRLSSTNYSPSDHSEKAERLLDQKLCRAGVIGQAAAGLKQAPVVEIDLGGESAKTNFCGL